MLFFPFLPIIESDRIIITDRAAARQAAAVRGSGSSGGQLCPKGPRFAARLLKIAHEKSEDVGLEFDEKDVLGEVIRADAAVAA